MRTISAICLVLALLLADGLQLQMGTAALAGGGRDGANDGDSGRSSSIDGKQYKLSDAPVVLAQMGLNSVYHAVIGVFAGNEGGAMGTAAGAALDGGNATAGGWGGEKP